MIINSTPYKQTIDIYSTLKTDPVQDQPNSFPGNSAEITGRNQSSSAISEGQSSKEQKGEGAKNKKALLNIGNSNIKDAQGDQQVIEKMRQIERRVQAHEQAHKAAAGQYAGPINYSYATGPDGRRYIIGGEVPINAPAGRTPEETIRIMEQVKRAAMAPADPSPQDVAVAAQAAQQQMAARSELNQAIQETDEYISNPNTATKGSPRTVSNNDGDRYIPSLEDRKTDNKKTGLTKTSMLKLDREPSPASTKTDSISNSRTNNIAEDTNSQASTVVSFEKLKAIIEQQRNYSNHVIRILDIVA